MTTILYSDGVFAADTRCTKGSLISPLIFDKLLITGPIDNMGVMAIAGSAHRNPNVFSAENMESIQDDATLYAWITKHLAQTLSDSELIWVSCADPQTVYQCDLDDNDDKSAVVPCFIEGILNGGTAAIGSGSEAAMGARLAGLGLVEAIRTASKIDAATDQNVFTVDVNGEEPKIKYWPEERAYAPSGGSGPSHVYIAGSTRTPIGRLS